MTKRPRLEGLRTPGSFGGLGRYGMAAGPLGVRDRVERYYLRHPYATQEQVRLATGAPRKTVRKAFDALVLAGRLTRAKAMVLKDCSSDCSTE